MSAVSRAFARFAKLPQPSTKDVVVERDLEVKISDGVVLLADRWYSPSSVQSAPVIVIRSPYGRRQFGFFGQLFAERGYQVVIQSCRGTFGSGGALDPFFHERSDGRATLDWIVAQPWFTGRIGMFGPSYMGLVQWAVAADPPEELRALAMQVTAANIRDSVVFPGGSFSLESGAMWVQQMVYQEHLGRFLWALATSRKRLGNVYRKLPLGDADLVAHGFHIDYYQDWLAHGDPGDPWWDEIDWSTDMTKVPTSSHIAGWYDIFLLNQLDDFQRLRELGRDARITIGPWTHMSPAGSAASMRDALDIFDRELRDRPGPQRDPVRIYVMGSDRWVDLPAWPPPAEPERWNLQPGGLLSPEAAGGGDADRYRFDPADPTPSLSGATLDPFKAGSRNQKRREERSDVLLYSSRPLTQDVTVAGPITSEVWVRSSRAHFDVFVRLCDVDTKGRSYNVSDGIVRILPESTPPDQDGITGVHVRMGPTARTFHAGHRIRLQVSSGAHPLFARNTGSGEPLGTAARLFPSDVEVFHDPDHPSAVELPVSTI